MKQIACVKRKEFLDIMSVVTGQYCFTFCLKLIGFVCPWHQTKKGLWELFIREITMTKNILSYNDAGPDRKGMQ